jgi:hypothetical protein
MARTAAPKASSKPKSKSGNKQIVIKGNLKNSTVIIGDNNNVRVDRSADKPEITPVSKPPELRPSPFPVTLLDRDTERSVVEQASSSGLPVGFYSTEGFGKTFLLEYFSHQLNLPDGVVYIAANKMTLDRVQSELFTAFFECDQKYSPNQTEYRELFKEKRALILLDDISLPQNEVEILLGYFPRCVVIVTSAERYDLRRGEIYRVDGLPTPFAVTFFQKRIGRELNENEKALAERICIGLAGNPKQILRVANQVKFDKRPIEEIAGEFKTKPTDAALYEKMMATAPEPGREFITFMASADGAVVPEEHLAGILNMKDLEPVRDDLLAHDYVTAHSPRYSISLELENYVKQVRAADVAAWKLKMIDYFSNWVTQSPSEAKILESEQILLAVIADAEKLGRWQDVMKIGRAIEPVFVLAGDWTVWNRLLQSMLRACRNLKDRFAEAWILHQLGSRALCLENFTEARTLLTQALEIRQVLGDKVGLEVTRHNLSQLAGGPPPKNPGRGGGSSSGLGRLIASFIILGGLGAVLLFGVILLVLPRFIDTTTPTDTVTPSHTPRVQVEIPDTFTPTPSRTPTRTPTKTPTDTPAPPSVELKVSKAKENIILYKEKDLEYFRVPVTVKVHNTGSTVIKDLAVYLGFEGSYAEFIMTGEVDRRSQLVISNLPADKTETYTMYVLVTRAYESKSLAIQVDADKCYDNVKCNISSPYKVKLPFIVYDFIGGAYDATWTGREPNLKSYPLFVGSPIDFPGFVQYTSDYILEDKSQPYVLYTHPTWVSGGSIEGDYPVVSFQSGDRLVARFGFIEGAVNDGATFSIGCFPDITSPVPGIQLVSYPQPSPLSSGPIFQTYDTVDGALKNASVTLQDPSCRNFYLRVDAGKSADNDWAVWVAAYIERP